MNGQNNKIGLSVFLGAVVIAAAIYLGLTKTKIPILELRPGESSIEASPMAKQSTSPTSTTTPAPATTPPAPDISWTKSDLVAVLSTKTGIPEREIIFSTGDIVDHGDTKLIRGTVQRQGEMGGAGFFAVADTSGVTVTYAGQGVPDCTEVNPYGYPVSWADYCMDSGNTVRR